MEIKREDFVKFRIVNTIFYALPVDFFEKKEEVVLEDASKVAEELIAEELRLKKEAEEEKKAKELAEKKAETAAKRKATLEAKKAAKLKELEELEEAMEEEE